MTRYHPGFDYANGYHTFAIEWTPTHVKHYGDNELVADREYQWCQNNAKVGDPKPVVLNLAVGGIWPGPPKTSLSSPRHLISPISGSGKKTTNGNYCVDTRP